MGHRTSDFSETAKVNEFDTHQEDDSSEDGVGKEAPRPGEEEEHHQDHSGRGDMRPLTASAQRVHHGSFGRAAVDDEGAAATGGSIGKRETDQVHWLKWSR